MINILFVCNGNVFRSMTAEKCFKQFLKEKNISDITVDSAGVKTTVQEPRRATIERLRYYGIQANHKYKQLTKEIVKKSDLIIAMNFDQKEFIKKNFLIDAPLFNEIAYGKKEGILDIEEFDPKLSDKNNKNEMQKYVYKIVDYIHDSMPHFFNNLDQWI